MAVCYTMLYAAELTEKYSVLSAAAATASLQASPCLWPCLRIICASQLFQANHSGNIVVKNQYTAMGLCV